MDELQVRILVYSGFGSSVDFLAPSSQECNKASSLKKGSQDYEPAGFYGITQNMRHHIFIYKCVYLSYHISLTAINDD